MQFAGIAQLTQSLSATSSEGRLEQVLQNWEESGEEGEGRAARAVPAWGAADLRARVPARMFMGTEFRIQENGNVSGTEFRPAFPPAVATRLLSPKR